MMRRRNCWVSGRSGGGEDLRRGAPLEHHALVQEADLVGDLAGEAHLVGGDHHRHAVALQVADHAQHLAHQLGVERARDLVQQQRPRPRRQGPGRWRRAAAGRRRGGPGSRASRPPARRRRAARGASLRGVGRAAPCARVGARHTFSSTVRCGNRLNAWKTSPSGGARAPGDTGVGDDLPVEQDVAIVDLLQQVDAAQERRLARAGRADQGDRLVLGTARSMSRSTSRSP